MLLRQQLIPYLYSVFEEAHRTGAPILRPLLFEYPDDVRTYTTDDEFLLGDAVLVAPIALPGIDHRSIYLPAGDWCHFWTAQRSTGPGYFLARAPLGEPAFYVRANRVIPLWPPMQHVDERDPDPLTLLLFPAPGFAETWLYEDAGEGFAHERGEFARWAVSCEATSDRVAVMLGRRIGDFRPLRRTVEILCRGLAAAPSSVAVDGVATDHWRFEGDTLTIAIADSPGERGIDVRGSGIIPS